MELTAEAISRLLDVDGGIGHGCGIDYVDGGFAADDAIRTARAAGWLADGIRHAIWMIGDIKERHPSVPDEGWSELDAIRHHLEGVLLGADTPNEFDDN